MLFTIVVSRSISMILSVFLSFFLKSLDLLQVIKNQFACQILNKLTWFLSNLTIFQNYKIELKNMLGWSNFYRLGRVEFYQDLEMVAQQEDWISILDVYLKRNSFHLEFVSFLPSLKCRNGIRYRWSRFPSTVEL